MIHHLNLILNSEFRMKHPEFRTAEFRKLMFLELRNSEFRHSEFRHSEFRGLIVNGCLVQCNCFLQMTSVLEVGLLMIAHNSGP